MLTSHADVKEPSTIAAVIMLLPQETAAMISVSTTVATVVYVSTGYDA